MKDKINKILTLPFLILIRGYQLLISPNLPPACRYTPTCSQYALEAFQKFFILKALYLSLKRLLSCHPWGGRGYDPVPD